jgi:hypothetical protein
MTQRFTRWISFHDAMARQVQDPRAQRPTGRSEEIEQLRVAIRRHEETIRLLEAELSEVCRLLTQKIGRLALLIERWTR